MMKLLRNGLCVLLLLLGLLAAVPAMAASQGLAIRDCHRVTLTKQDTTHDNDSVVRLWTADTCLDSVDEELADISRAYVNALGGDLPAAANKTSGNSRLDVEIRYSRTGLTWMSFMVQARVTYHRDLMHQEMTTRTYDMTTGERILLTDIFPEDSEAWDILAEAVRAEITENFPEEATDLLALYSVTGRQALSEMDFTLHGMSLVLHIPADRFYPEHHTLLEVTLMYPDIRPYMTEKAQTETDNLTYYKTCALTFDDGPSRTNSTLVLNALMEGGARGTFFVIGNRIGEYADLVQKEHDNGHAIGTHNWTHANVTTVSATTLRGYKTKCDAAMTAAIGKPGTYDRVPYGLYPQMIKAKVGWPLIQWSLDTYDWRGKSSSEVLSTVKKQISDGDIILMHDIKDNTPGSTTAIINYLQEQGYIFLTVDELMAKDGVELKPNTVYYRCKDGDTSKK